MPCLQNFIKLTLIARIQSPNLNNSLTLQFKKIMRFNSIVRSGRQTGHLRCTKSMNLIPIILIPKFPLYLITYFLHFIKQKIIIQNKCSQRIKKSCKIANRLEHYSLKLFYRQAKIFPYKCCSPLAKTTKAKYLIHVVS